MVIEQTVRTWKCPWCEQDNVELRASDDGMATIVTEEGAVRFPQDADSRPYVQRAVDGMRNRCAAGRCKPQIAQLN